MKSLYDLEINETGIVQDLDCNGSLKRRLLDLGIIKGTRIAPILKSPSGDPTAYQVRGTLIALRKEDSNLIKIEMS